MTGHRLTERTHRAGRVARRGWVQVLGAVLGVLLPTLAGAQGADTVIYYHVDAIGSVRMTTDATGGVLARFDFLPFGEEVGGTAGVGDRRWFAGMERDTGSGLEYVGARFYSSQTGRFTTADDPAYLDPFEPRTLNRYAYVYNNPFKWVDPDGHEGDCTAGYDTKTGRCDFDIGLIQFLLKDLFSPAGPATLRVAHPLAIGTESASPCVLETPVGRFTTGPNADARFRASLAGVLSSVFQKLNRQGVVPMITSGFRSAGDQRRMQQGASGPNPAAAVSWHQVGLAVDLNSQALNFGTIRNAMIAEGLTWGGTFRRNDPVHFQLPSAGTSPTPTMVGACGGR